MKEQILVYKEESQLLLVFPDRKLKSRNLLEVYCFTDGHTLAQVEYISNLEELKDEVLKQRVISNYLNQYETII